MKKLLCVFLVLLTILLVACTPTETNSNATSNTDVSISDTSSSTSTEYVSGLPSDLKFDGDEFIILSGYTHGIDPSVLRYFGGDPAEEVESNVVNDAAILRNNIVEDKLGIDIIERLHADTNGGGGGSLQELVTQSVNTGTVDYHMLTCSLYNCGNLTLSGSLENMKGMKYINNFEGEWWNQNFVNEVTIQDKVFYAVGDISFGHINCIYLIYYNKDLQKDSGLPDFYEYVYNDKWTYDQLFEFSKNVGSDLDGSGSFDGNDRIPFGGQTAAMWAIYYATGERITTRDDDGLPVLTFKTERNINALTDVVSFLMDDANYYLVDKAGHTNDEAIEMLSNNNMLFFFHHTGAIKDITSGLNCDFGFLPHPKYDENQEDYYALISPWGGLAVGVPFGYGDDDLDFISAVMEEMAVQGKNHLTSAYKEKMIKLQKTKDDQSQDMLDIVFKNSGCELGMIHKFGSYPSMVQLLLSGKDTAIESKIQANEEKARNDIDAFIAAIEAQ